MGMVGRGSNECSMLQCVGWMMLICVRKTRKSDDNVMVVVWIGRPVWLMPP